jgi:tRNA A-37 threonylcarbamoyl transferase component Bud32
MSSDVVLRGAPAPGEIVGDKYRVLAALASGGMGCLVSAEHLLLKKHVAIKFVLAERSESARKRLFREARAAQSLASDHVVRVFDLGVHEGAPYIVMELLEGSDLAARVAAEGPFCVEEAVDCVIEACVAVAEAHALGIVHRDIKPANLFSCRTATQELVKVLDFGISKVPEAAAEDCEKTAEDAVLGTPFFTSPEQLRNPARIDHRTDVWAFGVTLFYLLSAEYPFAGDTAREITAAIFTDPPRDLAALRPEVPAELALAIERALAKRPEDRTDSVGALVAELAPFASKRGAIAADRVAAQRPPPPPVPAERAAPSAATRTNDGLAAPLPTTAAATQRATRPRLRAWALGAGLAAIVAAMWLARPAATGRMARLHYALAHAAAPRARVPPTIRADEPIAPAAAPPPPVASSAPARRSAALPAVSRAAASKPPRRAIDGVPIVE